MTGFSHRKFGVKGIDPVLFIPIVQLDNFSLCHSGAPGLLPLGSRGGGGGMSGLGLGFVRGGGGGGVA